ADTRPSRTGQTRRDHAADRWIAPESRRLERKMLTLLSERAFYFRQRRAAACSDHQFGRLVRDDAAIGAHVKYFARRCLAVEVFGAGAAQAQRRASGARGADVIAQIGEGGVHHSVSIRSAAVRRTATDLRARACDRIPHSGAASESPCPD